MTRHSSAYSRQTSSVLFERRELHCPSYERVRRRASSISPVWLDLPAILLGQRIRQANGRSRASPKVYTTSCCPSGFRSVWWSPEATKPRSTDRTHNIRALPLAAFMHPCKRRSTSHISPCRAATRRILPMPFWTSCAIRRRHFVRARVMMYAGFIDCGVRCRFPLSVRCSGAGHLLILRE